MKEPSMILRSATAAMIAAAVLPLAACGADDNAAAGTGDDKAKMRQAELKFAHCMREQGIDFPDPQTGKGGSGFQKLGGDSTPEQIKTAEKACAKYRNALRPPDLSPEQQQEFKRAALANARCMREHGIDMPDPQFGAGGQATIRMRAGIKPDDPRFKAAQKACESTMPKFKKP
jgi:hypothetical protein